MQTRKIARAGAAIGAFWPALATLAQAAPLTVNKDVILAEHNKYRAEVGVPPLTWQLLNACSIAARPVWGKT